MKKWFVELLLILQKYCSNFSGSLPLVCLVLKSWFNKVYLSREKIFGFDYGWEAYILAIAEYV